MLNWSSYSKVGPHADKLAFIFELKINSRHGHWYFVIDACEL